MAKHCGKQNAMHLERLWQNIPAQLSRDQTGSAPKFAFKEAIPGLRGYDGMGGVIDWLQAARLILRHPMVNSGHLPFATHSTGILEPTADEQYPASGLWFLQWLLR
jgi:hypothetical protein